MNIRLGIIFPLFIYLCGASYASTAAVVPAGERILYRINPFGRSEFVDHGLVDYQGQKLRLAVFHTRIIGFDDTEKIYSEPDTGLPVRVERSLKWPFSRERIVEDYDQKNFVMIMRKYKGDKVIEEHKVIQDEPIYSAVLFPFSLRNVPDPQIGWSIKTAFPNAYEIKLVSIDHDKVPAGRFEAYHFISEPHTFDIWISKDEYRIPVKIQGRGTFGGYTMKLYTYDAGRHNAGQK